MDQKFICGWIVSQPYVWQFKRRIGEVKNIRMRLFSENLRIYKVLSFVSISIKWYKNKIYFVYFPCFIRSFSLRFNYLHRNRIRTNTLCLICHIFYLPCAVHVYLITLVNKVSSARI